MNSKLSQLTRGALVAFAALSTTAAFAYVPCAPGPQGSIPVDGSVDVPTNTQLAVWYVSDTPDTSPLRLIETETGEEVSVWIESVDDAGGLFLFHPDIPLQAQTSYTLEGSEFRPFASFETGLGTDTTPPEPSQITCAEHGTTENEGGIFDWISGQLAVTESEVYHRVEWSTDKHFSPLEVATLQTHHRQAKWSTESCGVMETHPHDLKFMRVIAIDLAGNESSQSNPLKVKSCANADSDHSARTCGFMLGNPLHWAWLCIIPVLRSRSRRTNGMVRS